MHERSFNIVELLFNPERERTLHAFLSNNRISENVTIHAKQITNLNKKTLKELTTLDLTY